MNKITQIEKTIRQTDRHRHTGRQAEMVRGQADALLQVMG